ncbi:MAG: hypothetical protein ACPGPA_11670, partial [Alphaproteobacteria bacterium]
LSRFWQAALSGLREVQSAFQPSMAAEMVLLRLCYLSQMPDPGQLVEQMRAGGAVAGTPPTSPEPPPPAPASAPDNGPRVALAPSGAPVSASPPPPAPTPPAPSTPQLESANEAPAVSTTESRPPDWADIPPPDAPDAPGGPTAATALPTGADALTDDGDIAPTPDPGPQTLPGGFEGLVSLIGEQASALLGAQLAEDVHLVRFEPPRLDLRLTSRAPRDLPRQVQDAVLRLTGERLTVAISDEEGQLPLAEARRLARQAELDEATRHPTVQAALQAFPSAKVQDVRYKPNAIPQEE